MCVKLLFDQNLSYKLVSKLQDIYPESKHVALLDLDTSSDLELYYYAQKHNFTLVLKDSDFNDISTLNGYPPHILWLRVGNSKISVAENLLRKHHNMICNTIQENKIGIIELNEL